MRKWRVVIPICILFCLALVGCGKDKIISVAQLQNIWTRPETKDEVYAYTLDEEGNLLTLEFDMFAESDSQMSEKLQQMTAEEIGSLTSAEREQLLQEENNRFFLRGYGSAGKCEFTRPLNNSLCDYVKTMAAKNGNVYFAPYVAENKCAVLYSYCFETETAVQMKELPYFKVVNRIVPSKDRIYLLGTNIQERFSADSRKYEYGGEKIFCYLIGDDKLYEMGIEEPIDICMAEDGRLYVYSHIGGDFVLQVFDESNNSMKVLAKTQWYKFANLALSSKRQEIIYSTVDRGLVLSDFSDVDVESELYPDGFFWDNNLCCVDGIVACRIDEGIVYFPLADVVHDNKVLRYITDNRTISEPFGCGYEIQKSVLEKEKFALKVMASDRDFDICFVNSNDAFSYTLKENSVFYPLNEIPGINEYLDACFPYVREAATDRDGNIWMLPIAVDIGGIIDAGGTDGTLLYKDSMTVEEYCDVYGDMSAEEKLYVENPAAYADKFITGYFLENGTVDTAEFRNTLQKIADCNLAAVKNVNDRYCHIFFESDYHFTYALKYGPDAVVCSEPGLTQEGGNAGYCQFLAVNPYSDNRDAALQYISTLIAYIMGKEDRPLFFADRTTDGSSYEQSLYELYKNGEIIFMPDSDIYWGYEGVLNGTVSMDEYVSKTETRIDIFLNE